MEFRVSGLRPPVCSLEKRGIAVVVHADDIWCIGGAESLVWLYDV